MLVIFVIFKLRRKFCADSYRHDSHMINNLPSIQALFGILIKDSELISPILPRYTRLHAWGCTCTTVQYRGMLCHCNFFRLKWRKWTPARPRGAEPRRPRGSCLHVLSNSLRLVFVSCLYQACSLAWSSLTSKSLSYLWEGTAESRYLYGTLQRNEK